MKKILIALLALLVAFSTFSCRRPEAVKELPTFIYNNGTEPQSLDPPTVTGVPEHNIYMALFEGLVTYDPKTLEAIPAVAESWEISGDGMTYTFKLRKDAVWSDGTSITAQQFVDSWLRFLNPELAAEYTYMMNMVVKGAEAYNTGEAGPEAVQIRVLDDHTFQFDLVGPAPYALDMLAHYAFSVQPLHAIEKYGKDWTHPDNIISNGPFVLEEWIPNDKLVVVKNDKYWDKDNVKLGKIVFLPIEDDLTALNMFLEGSCHWVEEVPDARLDEMKLHKDYHVNAAFISYYYIFNTKRPTLDDARVRKALAMSIDRQELVDRVTRGGQFPAFGITPPLPKYPKVVGFKEDVEAAKQLLAESGFPGGQGFPKFTILYNTSETHKRIAEYVQQKWAETLGIDVEIENQEWKTYLDTRFTGNFDISRAAWQGDYVDPNTFLDMWISTSDLNDGKWVNKEFDDLIYKAARMPAGPERIATLRKAEEIFIGQDMAVMPFYYYTRSNWIDKDVWDGWYENILDVHPFKDIYKK